MDFVINNGQYDLVIPSSTSFNIHMERAEGGHLAIYRKTSGEGWALLKTLPNAEVIDVDVVNDVKREYLLRSVGRPTLCVVTYADGKAEEVVIPAEMAVFKAKDADFVTADGKYIYVKV